MTNEINPNKIKKEIDTLISYLIGKYICDDQNFPSIKNTDETTTISFKNDNYISIGYSDIPYDEIYNELFNNRSFTMRLIDGALLQIMYSFKNNLLERHRLAFYPSPTLMPYPEDPESYEQDSLFLDIIQRRIIPFPIRFDFDSREGSFEDIKHPKSHLTLGDVKNCRIPVTSPLSPRHFIEFILNNFYETNDNEFTKDLPKHKIKLSNTISPNEMNIIHLTIPSIN